VLAAHEFRAVAGPPSDCWRRESRLITRIAWQRRLAETVTAWSGSPSVTWVFAPFNESGSSFGSVPLCPACVTSELGNRSDCAVPGQALPAVFDLLRPRKRWRHGATVMVDKITTGHADVRTSALHGYARDPQVPAKAMCPAIASQNAYRFRAHVV